jgi:hypothetical protein
MLPASDRALFDLLGALAEAEYRFVTPTPETHRRVIAQRDVARDLRDIFGWSLPFAPATAGPRIMGLLEAAGAIVEDAGTIRSAVRVSSVDDALFLHSAYPTTQVDAVFFGPDSYRFVNFLREELAGSAAVGGLVDIGAGSGVGGIMAAMQVPSAKVTLIDINPSALRLAPINALHNQVEVETLQGSGVDAVEPPIELAVSNPPYLMDAGHRSYRDGGGMYGAALSLEWALATAAKLAPRGRLLLYTASAIVNAHDSLKAALVDGLEGGRFRLGYRELDPDVFGEQLEQPHYQGVERIAVIGAVIERLQ